MNRMCGRDDEVGGVGTLADIRSDMCYFLFFSIKTDVAIMVYVYNK